MNTPASLHDPSIDISVSVPFTSDNRQRVSLKFQQRFFVVTLLIVDIVMVALSFAIAYFLRFETGLPIFYFVQNSRHISYLVFSVAAIPLWIALFWVYRLYDWQILLGGMKEYANIFQACLTGVISIAVAEFFLEWLFIARGWVGLFGVLSFLIVGGGRFLMRRLAYTLRCHGYLTSTTLIIGANDEACALGVQILAWPTSGLHLLGVIDNQLEPGTVINGQLRVIGDLEGLDEIVERYKVEDLIIASSAIDRGALLDIFKRYGISPNVRLHLSSGLFEVITTGLGIREIAYMSLIDVNRVRLTGSDLVLKTFLDYSLVLVLLLMVSPMLLLIALIVKMDSSGPVFYHRRVMGLNGKEFDAFKFRTMHINGDELLSSSPELLDELATKHKIKGDPRITRSGQFLRKFSLDEIPQVFNVLRGEMSLVGPRMISPPELKNYGQWAMNLLTVRPGITGLWQVSGRSDVSYDERVKLDMFYIRNYSIWLDLSLILRTIPVVLGGKGAY